MRVTVRQLRQIIEDRIGASPAYLEKERVREMLQQAIVDLVKNEKITSEDELRNFFSSADMALKALKMVPLNVYNKMSKT